MKPFLLFAFLIVFSLLVKAQTPLQFNYQAVARDNRGLPLTEQDIRIRFSIRDGSETGPVEYMEIRKIHTSQFGMFSVGIGSVGAFFSTGSLKDVKWQSGRKFLQAEMDHKGGNNYVDLGATQLVSVPYAFFALSSGDAQPGGSFAGAAQNGLSIEDSVAVLGNKEGDTFAQLKENRDIPLNGKIINFRDGVSNIALSKNLLTFQIDSAFFQGDNVSSGSSFLRVDPILPREDAVPFLFNRIAVRQHGGTVSPNEVVMWGHNINPGGGAHINGLPGIGYSMESNFRPNPSDRWVESHEFYITPAGRQVRLKSYTIDTKKDWVDFYQTIDNLYLKNPRSGEVFFRIDNFGDDVASQQLTMGMLRFDVNNKNKQFQLQSTIPDAELHINSNWDKIYLPGFLLLGKGPTIMQKDIITEVDNSLSFGGTGNRFANFFGINFYGERMVLKSGWNAYENIRASSTLDITGIEGFNQFRLRKTYTPSSSTDTNGNTGDMAWDENYIYIKTASGWKRTGLQSF